MFVDIFLIDLPAYRGALLVGRSPASVAAAAALSTTGTGHPLPILGSVAVFVLLGGLLRLLEIAGRLQGC